MREASILLPRTAAAADLRSYYELSRLLGVSLEQAEGACRRSRLVYERTAPKKRNPSQHRVMVWLTHEQKDLNRRLKHHLDLAQVDEAVHGYVPGRSIWTALLEHFPEDRLDTPLAWYGFDIADAFPSVSHRWVERLLREIFPGATAITRSLLVNLLCYRGRLNPGYPTSPVLFNLALRPIDEALRGYCDARDIVYTRYADDFTFSSPRDFTDQEKRELQKIVSRLPHRFRVVKEDEARLGEDFQITHRSSRRFRRRLLRDRARGVSRVQTVRNLQAGRA